MKKNFKPGTLGFHELVDRTALIMEMWDYYIMEHPSLKYPGLEKRAEAIFIHIYDFYQLVATK